MRLSRIKVRNYRLHHELEVALDPRLTVLRGPNEGGKSTLMEAIQRALFMKSATGGKLHSEMRSANFGGHPEVELDFEIDGNHYTVIKHFKGNGGTTTLRQHGGEIWQDAEAEEHLDGLLGTDVHSQRASKDRIREPWAHLLVLQGESGQDPSKQLTASHRADLLSRFQESGGGIVQQSETDARVAEAIRKQVRETFTDKRRTESKGSALAQAREDLDRSRRAESEAREELERLLVAIETYETSIADIAQQESAITNQKGALQTIEDKLEQVRKLDAAVTSQQSALKSVGEDHDRLTGEEEAIRALRTQIRDVTDEIEPKDSERKSLEAKLARQRENLGELDIRVKSAEKAAAKARMVLELHRGRAERHRLQDASKDLSKIKAKADRLVEERQAARKSLATLPEIDSEALTALKDSERMLRTAEATLSAISAGLEVSESDAEIEIGGERVSVGERKLFSEPVEISVGGSVRMTLTPGGGTSLKQATAEAAEARASFERSLQSLAVQSVGDAERIQADRLRLEELVDRLTNELDEIDGETLGESIAENEEQLEGVRAIIVRLAEQTGNDDATADLKTIRADMREAEERKTEAEDEERSLRSQREVAVGELERLEQQIKSLADEVSGAIQKRDELTGALKMRIEQNGDDATRGQNMDRLREALREEQGNLDVLQSELKALQPEILEQDRTRYLRAIEKARERLEEARSARDRAQGELSRGGASNPRERLATASAQAIRLESEVERIERHAHALRMLDDLFTEEQDRLAQAYTAPLVEKTSEYLRCVFGSDATLRVELDGTEFRDLGLSRELDGSGTFDFDALSGGTREQVAAALRLAVAEILAEGHGGTLPVVFDDAFTNSDPERTRDIQRMLDLAASRGLQIIALTCSPGDYQDLGATEVTVNAKLQKPERASTLEVRDETVASTSDLESHFLEVLKDEGGRSGNQSLREALGWEDATYDAVKNSLVASGQISLGRGRGGSVVLPD